MPTSLVPPEVSEDRPADAIEAAADVLSLAQFIFLDEKAPIGPREMRGLYLLLRAVGSTMTETAEEVRSKIDDPFQAGRSAGMAFANGEYHRGYAEGQRKAAVTARAA